MDVTKADKIIMINSNIINDNEKIAHDAFNRGDYVQAFLLLHTLIESLLRVFLKEHDEEIKFSKLIVKYKTFLGDNNYFQETFVKEFINFNKRRNRIVHQLWEKGYSDTNTKSKSAANAALILYGLLIEFLVSGTLYSSIWFLVSGTLYSSIWFLVSGTLYSRLTNY